MRKLVLALGILLVLSLVLTAQLQQREPVQENEEIDSFRNASTGESHGVSLTIRDAAVVENKIHVLWAMQYTCETRRDSWVIAPYGVLLVHYFNCPGAPECCEAPLERIQLSDDFTLRKSNINQGALVVDCPPDCAFVSIQYGDSELATSPVAIRR
jgi:hypothetical protein